MPGYEYQCRECGHGFTVQQVRADEAVTRCPKCVGLVSRLTSGGDCFQRKPGDRSLVATGKTCCTGDQR